MSGFLNLLEADGPFWRGNPLVPHPPPTPLLTNWSLSRIAWCLECCLPPAVLGAFTQHEVLQSFFADDMLSLSNLRLVSIGLNLVVETVSTGFIFFK